MENAMKHIIGLNVLIGIWLIAAPLTIGRELFSPAQAWNNLFLGLIVVGASAMVLADMPGQTVWNSCAVVGGAWLLVAPVVLPYREHSLGNDPIFGALILLVGAVEMWRSSRTAGQS
jgi:hypothetical protein